jgi:heterodisulfide reductase subunit B
MKFSYYPGCSLHSTGKEYEESTEVVCQALGIELVEIPDWNCCGASAAHSLNHQLSIQLNSRNLSLAQDAELDIAVPCSACYHNLKQAKEELKSNVQVRHLLDLLYHEIGIDNTRKMVKKSLSGLKAVPYYGCLITRPPQKDGFDSVEQPQSMDKLLEACGCEVMKWSYKTDCCGGSLSLSQTPVVVNLVTKLINIQNKPGQTALSLPAQCVRQTLRCGRMERRCQSSIGQRFWVWRLE